MQIRPGGFSGRRQIEFFQFGEHIFERRRPGGDAQQFHRARHRNFADFANLLARQIEHDDLMRVMDFGERHRQRAAAITPRRIVADALRQMQVAKRHVGNRRIENAGRQGFGAADHDAPLRFLGNLAAGQMAVAQRNDRLPRLTRGIGKLEGLLVQIANPGHVRIGRGFDARHVARPQKRHRDAPGAHLASPVFERHHQPRQIDTILIGADLADHAGLEQREKRRGRLQPARRIVIAGAEHDIQMRHPTPRFGKKTVKLGLRRGGRVAVVEDIAGNEQRVDLLADQRFEQPVEKLLVFVATLKLVKRLAEMPVRSVQQTHAENPLFRSAGILRAVSRIRIPGISFFQGNVAVDRNIPGKTQLPAMLFKKTW